MAQESELNPTKPTLLRRHKDSVLCCHIDSKSSLLVSGGVDDTAYVWDLKTYEVKFECQGHRESVVCCGFNLDSSLVATADMSGLVQVRETEHGELVSTYDVDEVRWLVWHNMAPKVLLTGTKTGEFWMWHVADSNSCKVFPSYFTPTSDGRLSDSGSEILVSYADGSFRIFNLRSQEVIKLFKDESHNCEIVSFDTSPDDRYIALGFMDSKIKIISRTTFKVLKVFNCTTPVDEKKKIIERSKKELESIINDTSEKIQDEVENSQYVDEEDIEEYQTDQDDQLEVQDEFDETNRVDDECDEYDDEDDDDSDDSNDQISKPDVQIEQTIEDLSEAVETLKFSRGGDYMVSANTCGSTYMWQVSTQSERAHIHLDAGVCRALWTPQNHCILACLDGSLRVYDVNLDCLKLLNIHKEQILDVCYRNEMVATCSDDGSISVFNYDGSDCFNKSFTNT